MGGDGFDALAAAANIRVSAQKRDGGLSVKTVRHRIDRPCKWWQPPHDKPEWHLRGKNKWRRINMGLKDPAADETLLSHEGVSKKKMRQIRRKQFFAFFEGFFDKYPNESLKLRNLRWTFSKEEKVSLLKDYFKRYFNEKLDTKKSTAESKLESEFNVSSILNQSKRFDGKLATVAENFKDAFLGKSKGILNSFGND